jgi:hypothetical protein
MPDSLQQAARLIARLFEPLTDALGGQDGEITAFVEKLGWTLPSVPKALLDLSATLGNVFDLNTDLELNLSIQNAGGAVTGDAVTKYAQLAGNVQQLLSELNSLSGSLAAQLPPGFLAATDLANQFLPRLVDLGVYQLMTATTKRMEPILRIAGIVEVSDEPADSTKFQPAFQRRIIRWDRLSKVLSDPKGLFIEVQGLTGPAFDGSDLIDDLLHLSFMLADVGDIDWPTPTRIQAITGAVPAFDAVGPPGITLPLLDVGALLASVSVLPLQPGGGHQAGLAFGLNVSAGVPNSIPLSDLLTLSVDAPDALAAGVSAALRIGEPPQARLGLEGPSGSPLTAKRIGATLNIGRTADPLTLLTLPGGSSLQAAGIAVGGGVGLLATGPEPYLDVAIRGGVLTLAFDQLDGFLQEILPSSSLTASFETGLAWSPTGVALTGSGTLTVAVPLHISAGPIDLETLTIVGTLADDSLGLETSLSASAALGPLQASVDRLGLVTTLAVKQGNLGPLDISLAFKPPNGVGLSIEAGVVSGGGYLYLDTARGQYSGALQLTFADFLQVSAIGLIETKLPDGSNGFSLLIVLTADFGAGIQLGFGFTLNAVGGLVGLNRGMQFQPLMDAIRTNAIESVLFPQDVIANAQRIITDLQRYFPPQDGTFLIGPMAKLGWGEPTLVSLSLGVIIEIPPGDIAILGILRLALPADQIAILVLQVNFAGAIEVDKQRLYFFATLFDSHILSITIDGSMGLLVAWGNNANFLVSVGGFHPQFNPPPLPFPTPRRISISLINESFARIQADGYFAVTTNTVQFGTHASYYFGFSALNVQGASSFDALIQFSPFHFIVSFSTSFSVNVFGIGCYGVDISLTVDGPTPYHASGTASISFFFFSVGIHIDFTWGDTENTTLPPVAVMPLLGAELGKLTNWRTQVPTGSNLLVSLRRLDPSEAALVLHPVGTLQISQRLLPLDLTIDKFGNQQPTDTNNVSLQVSSAALVKTRTLQESFAPSQYQNFNDAQKLSQPAYVPLDSGLELAAEGIGYASGTAITRIVRYDVTIIDTKLRRVFSRFNGVTSSVFQRFLNGASVARSPLSAYVAAQKRPFPDAVSLAPETYAVAFSADNSLFRSEAASFTSQVAAKEYLARAVANDATLAGTLHILPQFELAA